MLKHCGNCANYIWGDGKTPLPEDCVTCKNDLTGEDKGPSNWRPQSMPNADCIRSMSDEKLAELIGCIYYDREDGALIIGKYRLDTFRDLKEWLQQPVDTGTDINVGRKGTRE